MLNNHYEKMLRRALVALIAASLCLTVASCSGDSPDEPQPPVRPDDPVNPVNPDNPEDPVQPDNPGIPSFRGTIVHDSGKTSDGGICEILSDGFVVNGIKYDIVGDSLTVSGVTELPAGAGGSVRPYSQLVYGSTKYNTNAIGDKAFFGNNVTSTITEIDIPYGIRRIGDEAFGSCASLKSCRLPETVVSIGDGAFSHCQALTAIELPEGVTVIPDHAFAVCNVLRKIRMSPRVTSIGKEAFYQCTSLVNPDIPSTVTHFGSNCLYGVTFDRFEVPAGTSAIGPYTFAGIKTRRLVLPEGLVEIGDHAFFGAEIPVLESWPQSVETVGAYAFAKTVIWPVVTLGNVTSVGEGIFCGARGITELTFPDNIDQIPAAACTDISSLKRVDIGSGAKVIGVRAFKNCRSLTDISLNDVVYLLDDECFRNTAISLTELPDKIRVIGCLAFYDCPNIKRLRIGPEIKAVGHHAFYPGPQGCFERMAIEATVPPEPFFTSCVEYSRYGPCFLGWWDGSATEMSFLLYVPKESVSAYSRSEFSSFIMRILPLEDYDKDPPDIPSYVISKGHTRSTKITH